MDKVFEQLKKHLEETPKEILEKEVQKRIKAKKVYITRGGACICSHTGPDILAISCSN